MLRNNIKISVDVMGGANAPRASIEAISNICKMNGDDDVCISNGIGDFIDKLFFFIVGDEEIVLPIIEEYKIPKNRYKIVHSSTVILDNEKPSFALRNGKNSSMYKGINLVNTAEANAFVSSGNTGAMMVISKLMLGCLEGIKRPAIIGVFPTINNKAVMLDMGANIDCNEYFLFQFALMGSCFAKSMLNFENPKLGILNVGIEDNKGRELENKTAAILKDSGLNFIGYVEGHDIFSDIADVIVTDGFTGNIALKASEGTAKMLFQLLKNCMKDSLCSKIGAFLLKHSFKKMYHNINPADNNGAMLIGLNGIIVKSHGNSDAYGVFNAIIVAIKLVKENINSKIIKELQHFEEIGVGFNIVDKIKYTSAKLFGVHKEELNDDEDDSSKK